MSMGNTMPLPTGPAPIVPSGYAPVLPHSLGLGPRWNSGVCGICEPGCCMCCQAILCSYCMIGYIQGRMKTGKPELDCLCCCGLMIVDQIFGGICSACVMVSMRKKLAERYGIVYNYNMNAYSTEQEGCCDTCFCPFFCKMCSLCQMEREMAFRDEHPGMICVSPNDISSRVPPPMSGAVMGGHAMAAMNPNEPHVVMGQPQQSPQKADPATV